MEPNVLIIQIFFYLCADHEDRFVDYRQEKTNNINTLY